MAVDTGTIKDQLHQIKNILPNSIEKEIRNLLNHAETITVQQSNILQRIISQALRGLTPTLTESELLIFSQINIFTTPESTAQLSKFGDNVAQMFNYGIRFSNKTPSTVVRQLENSVRESSQKYITNMGDDLKTRTGNIVAEGIRNKSSTNDIVARLEKELNMTRGRANMIARTETMRAAHSGSLAQARRDGKNYYIVDNRAEACKYCQKTYLGRVYSIDDMSRFPPLHPHCACIPVYFYDKTEAQGWSDSLKEDITGQRQQLINEGKVIPDDGTGAFVNKKAPEDRIHN